MDLKTIGRLSKTPPAPEPQPEPAPEPVPAPAKEVAPERPVSVYTAITRPATAPAAKAKKSASAKAKSAKAPAAKPKKVVSATKPAAPVVPAAPAEAEPTVTITLDDEQVQTDLPQLVPFGDPAAREYLGQQATALRSDPMYKAAVALDKRGLAENIVDFFLSTPASERKEKELEQFRKRTDYDAGVYEDAAARAELLRVVKPDRAVMNNMPPNLDEDAKRRYINTAKAVALNELIKAKRYAPTFKLDRDSVSEAANLDMLEPMLEKLAMPKLRPYEGTLPGLNVLTDYFSSPETETKTDFRGAPGTFEAAQKAYSSSIAPYMEPVIRDRSVAAPNPQLVPTESPLPDFVNDNIFAPVYAYMDRKRAEAAAKDRQPK